jgi:hypothetical protein
MTSAHVESRSKTLCYGIFFGMKSIKQKQDLICTTSKGTSRQKRADRSGCNTALRALLTRMSRVYPTSRSAVCSMGGGEATNPPSWAKPKSGPLNTHNLSLPPSSLLPAPLKIQVAGGEVQNICDIRDVQIAQSGTHRV